MNKLEICEALEKAAEESGSKELLVCVKVLVGSFLDGSLHFLISFLVYHAQTQLRLAENERNAPKS